MNHIEELSIMFKELKNRILDINEIHEGVYSSENKILETYELVNKIEAFAAVCIYNARKGNL